ncbi:MAG TPA: RAD52 family DNA repair protein [Microvirga sp.]|jgi:DNA repair and recombination protein RAD52|nr:RAD52 family DNA repair protein [Microvirga sp.]
MSFTDKQIEMLKAPLSKEHVKSRSQAGRSLSYIEGWHAIAEANRIFGFDKWERQTLEIRPVCEPYQDQKGNWRVGYMARVRICVFDAGGLNRDGCGYGSGIDRDLGSAHESAIKEAETDAMKRALMTFGNPFGLALYDKEQRNVIDEAARPVPQPTSEPEEGTRDMDRAGKVFVASPPPKAELGPSKAFLKHKGDLDFAQTQAELDRAARAIKREDLPPNEYANLQTLYRVKRDAFKVRAVQ